MDARNFTQSVHITRADNGFVMHHNSKLLVFSNADDLSKEFLDSFSRRLASMKMSDEINVTVNVSDVEHESKN